MKMVSQCNVLAPWSCHDVVCVINFFFCVAIATAVDAAAVAADLFGCIAAMH